MEHGAKCADVRLAGAADGAAFQFAEVVGVEGDLTVLVVVVGGPERDGFG
jgi:hypothetical protein